MHQFAHESQHLAGSLQHQFAEERRHDRPDELLFSRAEGKGTGGRWFLRCATACFLATVSRKVTREREKEEGNWGEEGSEAVPVAEHDER